MELKGPRVDRELAPPATPPPVPGPRTVVLPPRGQHVLKIPALAEQKGPEVFALFPAAAGAYRLTVEVRAQAWPAGAPRQARPRSWRAGPALLSLRPGTKAP
jgi:hypothetical protein